MAQPCEHCGNKRASSQNSKYEDVYMRARLGSRAYNLYYEFERLCGKCNLIKEVAEAWEKYPLPA